MIQKNLKAPDSCFMRSNELLAVKFVDKKATGDKEIYLIDTKGEAKVVNVERFQKGNVVWFFSYKTM